MTISSSEQQQVAVQIATLVARCRKGNEVIARIWREACENADDREKWAEMLDLYHRGTVKLQGLCDQLEALGYTGCLYDEPKCRGTNELTCFACPSKTPYWREGVRQERLL